LLVAVVTFVVLLILAVIVKKFDAQIGDIIEKFAALIALLLGVVYFLFTPARPIL
jgi:hypothetical protein